ncbi:MAG: site-2 protease family protein [Ardenticatenaceae bacterium]|nr:site-2 protease family protein [Ardenticatenaceae bacterium]
MSILWAIGGFIIILTPIVLVHELGHFWAARLSNIRVEEFGLGLPPRAMTLAERKGTIFSLNWIPLGGFVRPAGEDDPNVPDGLAAASKRARFFVLVSGAGMNFIAAIVIFWVALMIGPPAVAISNVNPGSPAETAGLQANDVILEVDGVRADSSSVLVDRVHEMAGQPIQLLVSRDGQQLNITLVPRSPGEYDSDSEGPIGVGLMMSTTGERISRNPIEAGVDAVQFMGNYVSLYLRLPAMLLSGDITPQEARPVSIVGISQIAGQAAEASAQNRNLFPLLSIAAFINVALGLTNLLPLPALDGGRILFVVIEAIRGRRIEPEREGMVHVIGMLVLLGLMVLMIVQDIVNPIIPFQ